MTKPKAALGWTAIISWGLKLGAALGRGLYRDRDVLNIAGYTHYIRNRVLDPGYGAGLRSGTP